MIVVTIISYRWEYPTIPLSILHDLIIQTVIDIQSLLKVSSYLVQPCVYFRHFHVYFYYFSSSPPYTLYIHTPSLSSSHNPPARSTHSPPPTYIHFHTHHPPPTQPPPSPILHPKLCIS